MATPALYSAATGMRALSTQLDVISNNIANSNNDGYKASRANFEDVMYQYLERPGTKNEQGDIRPVGVAVGYGTRVSGTQLDMSSSSLITTGRELDVAINGNGLFQVRVPAGQGDGLAYTRTGKFFINPENQLVLSSSAGYKLEPAINVPANTQAVSIGADGKVTAKVAGQADMQDCGQLQLAMFVNPQGLEQIGGNLYQRTEASGSPQVVTPGTEGSGQLQQGAVEASNVDPVKELVELIKTQRSFELNTQSIQAANEMLQQVANLRR